MIGCEYPIEKYTTGYKENVFIILVYFETYNDRLCCEMLSSSQSLLPCGLYMCIHLSDNKTVYLMQSV